MKRRDQLNKLGALLVILATMFFACNLAPISLPNEQSVPISAYSLPDPTNIFESSTSNEPPALIPNDIIWEMLGHVNQDRALIDLRKLTGEEPICIEGECYTIKNRLTGSEGLSWAKDYIYQELAGLGYSVELLDWSRSGHSDQNMIVRKQGALASGEAVYFVAHLDGVQNSEGQSYPAADDNGSGVVDLLELARAMSSHSFERTVVLFISTGEEQGTLGVQSYLSQISQDELNSIRYVVNVDMIGYDENQDAVMELWHADHPPSLALTQMMSETIQTYQIALQPLFIVGCG